VEENKDTFEGGWDVDLNFEEVTLLANSSSHLIQPVKIKSMKTRSMKIKPMKAKLTKLTRVGCS
jgi:hypothetical protein